MHSKGIVWFAFVAGIQGLASWLVYILLRRSLPVLQKRAIQYGYWGITLIAGLIASLSRFLFAAGAPSRGLELFFVWPIGLLLMLPLLLLLCGIAYGAEKWAQRQAKAETGQQQEPEQSQTAGAMVTRRDFLQGAIAIGPVTGFGLSAKGIYGAGAITIQRHSFTLPGFPEGLSSLKVAQLSDSHIGTFFGMKKLDEALEIIAGEKPDLLAITGDLIDELSLLEATMKRLTRFQATLPYGIFYSWGNHEYFRDINVIRKAVANSPLVLLENSSQVLLGGKTPLYIVGVDYPWANNKAQQAEVQRQYMEKAFRGVPQEACKLLMSHHPDFIDNSFAGGIPLTLCGHTHGGQIGLFGRYPLPSLYKYMRGIYRQDKLTAYVSTGAGHWLPFRLGCPAEIGIFTLTGEKA